jgi:hypothetical protein
MTSTNDLHSINRSSLTVAAFGFRTIGRLASQPLRSAIHFETIYPLESSIHQLSTFDYLQWLDLQEEE